MLAIAGMAIKRTLFDIDLITPAGFIATSFDARVDVTDAANGRAQSRAVGLARAC
jgi:hypothetical protein